MSGDERDEREVGERAARALRNENRSKEHTRAVIAGRGVAAEFRQRPQDRADRAAARRSR